MVWELGAAGILEHFYENSSLSLLLEFTLNYFQNYRYRRSTIADEIFRQVYPEGAVGIFNCFKILAFGEIRMV